MGDFLFDSFQPFHFYVSDEKGIDYALPPNAGSQALHRDIYAARIEEMLLVNSPEIFGLHANAEIGYLTNASRQLWSDLVELQPRVGGGSGGISREEYISGVARSIQEKLPEEFDIALISKEMGVPSPTQVVLLQEMERWNALVARMRISLRDLQRALVGEIGMSAELDELAFSLFNGALPGVWRKLAPATEKSLGAWLDHFLRRLSQYRAWIAEGDPKVMWLSGLHIPESYLTALVQTTCRRYLWPLDKSTLYTQVTKFKTEEEVGEKLLDGCYVSGLYLEGAAWDYEKSMLRRQDPKILVQELPIMQVIPIEASKLKLQNTFRTLVYVTQARRSAGGVGLVLEADLATDEHSSHWVLQGVALCLNIN
jgi:dynein heavy chain